MTPTQQKYLSKRLADIAKSKIETLNENEISILKKHNAVNSITLNELLHYLNDQPVFKVDLNSVIPDKIQDLIDFEDLREYFTKQPLVNIYASVYITVGTHSVRILESFLPKARLVVNQMNLVIDEIMLGDSNKATAAIQAFEDFNF